MLGGEYPINSILSLEPLTELSDLSPCVYDSCFCKAGTEYIRLSKVQRAFGLISRDVKSYLDDEGVERFIGRRCVVGTLSVDDLSLITELCTAWRNQREFVPVQYSFADGTVENSFHVAVKRGNDQYVYAVRKQFDRLLTSEPVVFFDPAWGEKRTPMLYITVTTDQSIVGHDVAKAWLSFGEWWNSFITNLRQQFGGIAYIRTWQSQQNYYPHGHALVYFKEKEFTAVRWVNENNQESFRLPANSDDRKAIKEAWKWGFCDIQCVADSMTAYKDLLKYVTRDLEGGESDKTNGMVWFFEKRSFAISGDYFNLVWKEPEVLDLINADATNSNFGDKKLIRIDIFPIMGGDLVPKNWQFTFDNEDPPPEMVAFFNLLKSRFEAHECKHKRDDGVPVFLWSEVFKK